MTEPIRTAIVKDGKVVNVVLMAEGSKWTPPKGHKAIPHEEAGPGWSYENGEFIEPPYVPPVDNRTYAQKRAGAYPRRGDQFDAAYKDRQKARGLTAKALEALKDGDTQAAIENLIEALTPSEESDLIDDQISAVKQRYPKT